MLFSYDKYIPKNKIFVVVHEYRSCIYESYYVKVKLISLVFERPNCYVISDGKQYEQLNN